MGHIHCSEHGDVNARTQVFEDPKNPCLLPPSSGYHRLENQLYRVEVHTGGTRDDATFKWSRDNGMVVTSIEQSDVNVVTVFDIGKDEVLGFAGGQWVEIVDAESTLKGTPHPLVQIDKVDPATRKITMQTSVAAFKNTPYLKLRRWDPTDNMAKTDGIEMTAGWLDLEGGIQVQFAQGSYRSGDYWLIPARTATGEIEWPPFEVPNTHPIPQPPIGIRHHYCRLALLKVQGGNLHLEDCREKFPPLTEICAEDVCFDNSACKLPEAKTVQEALDRLCAARDLRHHNKHLHGWGIVCGLQVVCGPDPGGQQRRHVTVRSGYAIDCEGNDILLEKDEPLDLLEMIEEQVTSPPSSPPDMGDREVCLLMELDREQKRRYRVEKYDPSSDSLQSLLAGTLLLDVYNDCIKPIQDFLQQQLTPPENEKDLPAGPVQQRLSALTNLLAQPINPEAGQHIFLSPREHAILHDFYTKLRALLQSETFCAMFENVRPFPTYPFRDLGMDTIFGKGQHTRLRLRPGGREAYTVGPGLNPLKPSTTLHRFDLERQVLIAQIDPIAGAPITGTQGDTGAGAVQDVAFSPDGRLIYMIASTRDDADTLFRVGVITPTAINWRPSVTICGVKLVTLATTAADRAQVYAIGLQKVTVTDPNNQQHTEVRGAGLYQINPDQVNPTMTPLVPFNAYGHLEISVDGRAFATAAPLNTQPTTYDRIRVIQLPAGTGIREILLGPAGRLTTGRDDIALHMRADNAQQDTLYSVVGPDSQGIKHILAHDIASGNQIAAIQVENTTIRLEPFGPTGMLLLTSEDGYCVRMLDMTTHRLIAGYLLPMQVGPIAIASDAPSRRVYVLNYASNTITTAAGALFSPEFRFRVDQLAAYRKAVLEAFADLLGGFLQYLKDCLCDHFLVNCPECTEDDKLYLACISIRHGQIYKVCNFSKRRYVKSFPTVDYWLSVIPIMPLLDRLIEQFCCSVLPNIFSRYRVPDFSEDRSQNPTTRVQVGSIREGIFAAQGSDILGMLSRAFDKGLTALGVVQDAMLRQPTALRLGATDPALASSNIMNQPIERSEALLRERGVEVERTTYDPSSTPNLTAKLAGFFRTPTPGTKVTLYEENGRVRYYSVADQATATEAAQLRGEVETLKAELARLQQTHLEAVTALGDLRTQVDSLVQRRPRRRTE